LGRSDLRVSCIGIGGNTIGRFLGETETHRLLDEANREGINLVDTADVYSDGLSEELIGGYLSARRRQDWIIASKVGVRSHEDPSGKGERRNIRMQLEASLNRLRTDYIDLYQMHHYDPATPVDETLAALSELQAEGKIRYFGASNHSPTQLRSSVLACRGDWPRGYTSLQAAYNLFKREIEVSMLPFLEEESIGLLVYGILARGVLSGKYACQHRPRGSRALESKSISTDLDPLVLARVDSLSQWARERRYSATQLAIAWGMSRKGVSSLIVGLRGAEQLIENVEGVGWELSHEELGEVDRLVGDLRDYDRFSLGSPLPHGEAASRGARSTAKT
jgi:1-deoxyxylulose-5-phosphate synthase